MSMSAKKRASLAGWAVITTMVVLYGPMAIEYMWRFFNPDAPQLWNHTYSAIVNHKEAYGPGSIHADQAVQYSQNRYTLLFHTTAGGIAIVLFAAQFSARVRRNLARHRIIGRVAVSISLIGMLGAMAYLIAVGPDATFDGPGFYLQLWGLALGTTVGVTLGFVAAVKRQIAMHQALMAFAFALLLTAPLLRVGYLVFGNLWAHATQLETNLAGAAFLSTGAPYGAFLAARALDTRRRRNPAIRALPGRLLDYGVLGAAAIATPLLAWRYTDAFGGFDRVTATGLIGVLAGLMIAVVNHLTARHGGNDLAAEEWRVIGLSLVAAAPTAVILWALYDLPFTTHDAYTGMLLTAPALALSAGYFTIVWRRRTLRRPATTTPASPQQLVGQT